MLRAALNDRHPSKGIGLRQALTGHFLTFVSDAGIGQDRSSNDDLADFLEHLVHE